MKDITLPLRNLSPPSAPSPTATALALGLAHAEEALQALTAGQVDAIVDSEGKTYLLRPAQERLRESEDLFSKAFWLSQDCVTIERAADHRLLKANSAACRLWSGTPEGIIGRPAMEFYRWLNEEERVDFVGALEQDRACLNREALLLINNGEKLLFNICSHLITLEGESCILSVMRNITEERKLEDALRASEVRYRRLFETAKDGILILDAETGVVVDVNPFLMNIMGFPQEYFLGKAVWELGFFRDVMASEEKFQELREKEYVRYENLPLKTRDGHRLEVEFISNVYLVNGSKVIQCNVRDVTERKKAEETVRLRESALAEVTQGVLICDENRKIIYSNASFTKITGYPESELLGRNCSILQGPETDQKTVEKVRLALNEGRPFEGEILNYRKDGQCFWNELSIAPLPAGKGRPIRFVGIQRDVTERKMAAEALQMSEESIRQERALLRALIDSIPDLIFLKDRNSVFLGCNKAFEQHLGVVEKDLVGKTDFDITPKEAPLYLSRDRQLFASGKPQTAEEWIPSRAGEDREFETVKTPYHGPSGEWQGLIAVSRDITERKRAEEAIRESEERFSGAFEHAPIGVALASPAGRWLKVNRALCDLVGYSEAELLRRSFQDITYPEDLPRDLERVRQVLAGEMNSYQLEKRYIHARGHLVTILLNVSLVRDSQGQPRYFIAQIQDITERKQAETALRESQVRYQSLFENMVEGYAYCRFLREPGRPPDFVYLEVNSAFEALTGLSGVAGKKVSEVIPGIQEADPELLELYGRVAATGRPERSEIHLKSLDIWFSISVYSPEKEYFVAVFDNITERKQAELKIRFNEQRFRSLVEATTAIVWDTPASGEFETDQPSWRAFTGQSFEELRGSGWLDAIHPDDRAETVRAWSAAFSSKSLYEVEHRLRSRDGAYRNMQGRAVPILAEDGTVLQWIGVHSDITARKQAEEGLRESQRFAESIADNSTSLIYVYDLDTRRNVYANRSIEESLGYSSDQITALGDNLLPTIIHPEDLPRIEQIHASFAQIPGARILESEYRIKDDDGHWRWFWGRETVFNRHPDGSASQIMGTAQDITERKQAEQALSFALERLQLAIKAGRAGTWEYDLLTGTVDWDDQMLALYGKNAENIEDGADRWNHSIVPEDLVKAQVVFEETVRGGKDSFDVEFRIHRTDDQALRHIRGAGIILRDHSGQAVHITGLNWDITEERVREETLAAALVLEKELSEKARAGDRAKSEFLAVMSHEIRTPMNGILGFSDLLLRTADLPADCRDYVNIITSSGEALLRILDDILDFSRLDAGGLKIEKSLFSVRDILKDVHTLLAPQTDEKQLSFRVLIDAGVPEQLWNDSGRLRQILLNLVGNAIKFTSHGSILLGARLSGEPLCSGEASVDLFVRDSGPGIPEEELVSIFEPFTQADSSISRRYGGTGLGLSISRNLIELMGGKLSVQSKVGAGSEFSISLSALVPGGIMPSLPDSDGEIQDETFAAKHPLDILLVEDDRVNLKLIRLVLRRLGYEALVARDGAEAVEIYRQQKPDCILMDLQMPKKDGLQATREIRAIEKSTPSGDRSYISALTANIVAEDRRRCFEAGMDGYLNKPIKRAPLAKTLERASNLKVAAARSEHLK